MFLIKIINFRGRAIVEKRLADLTILQTTLNLVPIIDTINAVLQPIGVIPKAVLLIPLTRQGLASTFVGDNKGKDGEAKEEENKEEHDKKVNPEEPCHPATRPDEPSQGHQQDEDTQYDDGGVQKALALGVGLP